MNLIEFILIFREKKSWNVKKSLLLDGGNENKDINLVQEIFWPDNIVSLFRKYKVKKKFDLLSVDTDSYDFFMLETILEAGYSPRVIVVEYNANFEITEARSIMPPDEDGDWQRWDSTTYQVSSSQSGDSVTRVCPGHVSAGGHAPPG